MYTCASIWLISSRNLFSYVDFLQEQLNLAQLHAVKYVCTYAAVVITLSILNFLFLCSTTLDIE